MTNDGITEGHTENSGCSDLSPAIGYAGQHYYNESDILADCGDRQPFNPDVEKEAHFRTQHYFTFGSGETRMQMQKNSMAGEPLGFAPPRSRYFMKYLALLVVGASVSYGQQFNGTVFDLDTGRTQVISGSMSEDDKIAAMRQRTIDRYRRMNAELEASIASMRSEAEMARQTRELREQTELLRKIANE